MYMYTSTHSLTRPLLSLHLLHNNGQVLQLWFYFEDVVPFLCYVIAMLADLCHVLVPCTFVLCSFSKSKERERLLFVIADT